MAERPYEVTDTATATRSVVIAKTPAQALYSVTRGRFKARPLSGLEAARLPAGTVITDATAEPQQPLDNADEDGDSEDDLPHGFRGGDAVE